MNHILKIIDICKNFNGIKALDHFSCEINKSKIVGLIGPNGAGKTTLFNIITGFLKCDNGIILFQDKNILDSSPDEISLYGITRTFQNLRIIKQLTVLENVMLSFKYQIGESFFNAIFKKRIVDKHEKLNRDKAMSFIEYADLIDKTYEMAGDLSYGQQKLLNLICCLASDAELLLLDEPVAGINPKMIEKILSIILELPGKGKSVVLIEHNMDAIMQICHHVIFLDEGKKICEGTPEQVRNDPNVIDAYLD